MNKQMRLYHRYLGFFLAGIMAVYALSGIVMIFRNTDVFMKKLEIDEVLPDDTRVEDLGKVLGIRRFEIQREENGIVYFKEGIYNTSTHQALFTKKELPFILEKMTELHKATSDRPLAFLNVFFGIALFFFVFSAFWMFAPGSDLFRKGVYFAIGGLVFTLLMLFI